MENLQSFKTLKQINKAHSLNNALDNDYCFLKLPKMLCFLIFKE